MLGAIIRRSSSRSPHTTGAAQPSHTRRQLGSSGTSILELGKVTVNIARETALEPKSDDTRPILAIRDTLQSNGDVDY